MLAVSCIRTELSHKKFPLLSRLQLIKLYCVYRIHVGSSTSMTSKADLICCADFLKSMISLGISEHEKDMHANIAQMRREEEQIKESEKRKNDAQALRGSAEYCTAFDESDTENALLLIFDAARK